MKNSILLMSLLFIMACETQLALNLEESRNSNQKMSIPQVYFNKTRQFVDITVLNRENKALALFDQVVFSSQEAFVNDKKTSNFDLIPIDEFKKEEDIAIKVSSFCSHSREDIQDLQTKGRLFQEWASSSYHSSLSIIDLLPMDLLSENLEQDLYCSFIFALRNRQEDFNYYSLTQQTIKASPVEGQESSLALVQETNFGYEYAPLNYVIHKKNVKSTQLLNNTNQVVTKYELFCAGKKIMGVPNFNFNTSSIFMNLMSVEFLPKGLKTCRFFSKNGKKITGVTGSFLLDFDSFSSEIKALDLSQIEAPVFVDISEKDIKPADFRITRDFSNWVKKNFWKRSQPYISPPDSLALNSYIYFKNLNELSHSYQNYSSIEMILKTQCFDSNLNTENNFFGNGELISTVIRLPLREKTPIAVALPDNIFGMGFVYDQWLKELIKLQKRIDRDAKAIGKRAVEQQERTFYKARLRQLEIESALRKMRHQITCIYTVGLEDKYNSENRIEFQPQARRILWTRDSYGVSYTAFPGGENPFITWKQQANTDKRRFESIRRSSVMGYLSLTFFDLMETSFLEEGNHQLEKFVLNCRSEEEPSNKLSLSWPYDYNINNQIVLKDLFSHPDFQAYIKVKGLVACRVLFYGESDQLRYFSGEIRLR